MRYIFVFLFSMLIYSCSDKSNIYITNINEEYWCNLSLDLINVKYFDSAKTKISKISYLNGNEERYVFFYKNQTIKLSFNHLYLEEEVDIIDLKPYNSYSFYDDSFIAYTNVFYNSYYRNGNKKTVFKCSKLKNEFQFLEFYENGSLKSVKLFRHKNYGEFFVPFGKWKEYNEYGELTKLYDATDTLDYSINSGLYKYAELVGLAQLPED